MDRREYPIRNPKQAEAQKRAFQTKLARNQDAGLAAFQSGNIEGFTDYTPERMENEFEFRLELALPTQKEIIERVVEPLKKISDRHGISQFYPYDGELQPHVTFEVAKFQGLTDEEKSLLFKELGQDTRLATMAHILKGLDFSLDTVVTAGRDTYLCVGEFGIDTGALHKARRIINRVMEKTIQENPDGAKSGLVPVNYQDIVHSTVGRINVAPHDPTQLLAYAADVEKEIGTSLKERPIVALIDNVYYGSALDFHTTNASPQLKTQ